MNPNRQQRTRTTLRSDWKDFSVDRLGTWLLVSLLVVAPLSEALNNMLIVALFIWWLSTQKLSRDLRGVPMYLPITVFFCVTPLISLVSSDLADPLDRIGEVTGSVKLALLLLPVYSLSTQHRNSTTLVTTALTIGALLGYIEAVIAWEHSSNSYPVLKALAGANGSALYMSVVLISAISLSWSRERAYVVLGYFGIPAALSYFVVTRSITAAIVSVCVLLLAVIMSMCTASRKAFITALACIVLFAGVSFATPQVATYWSEFAAEFEQNTLGSNPGSKRFEIFNTAWEVFHRNLWFGAGYRQFGKATSVERVAEEIEAKGRSYQRERGRFFHVNHGHNVWAQVLVERGLIGIALLISFFVSTALRIFGCGLELYRKKVHRLELVQTTFISAAVWAMLFVGGIGNSTLHTEHGMVALLLLVWSLTRFNVLCRQVFK